MIKVFIFTLMVCSATAKQCINLPNATKTFDSYSKCALYGYDYAHTLLSEYDVKIFERNRIYVAFTCEEKEVV